MCRTAWFFDILLFYFITLSSATLVRREITYKGVFYIFTAILTIFVIYLMSLFTQIILQGAASEFMWQINHTNWMSLEIALSLKLDALSYLFVLLVSVIGLSTNVYILNYFKYEAHEDIFALLINWFMFSMILLVLANNLFTLFLGWESIGLSSFFLINFWSTRRGTVKSSFKAFCFNKVSDVFLFLFLILINYTTSLNSLSLINMKINLIFLPVSDIYNLAAIMLFLCTLFKSAQIIGHLWLPDSMEAPVPASALIHSATLVSAGIYLLLRFTPLISLNCLQIWAINIGAITAAYGGIVSASQTDMKKLLAYSTISHCGFLFVAVGTESYTTAVIYLFLHGLFKALTFFCAGSFIRVAGSQDTRQMGALNRVLPVDTMFLIICAFNLGGLPFSLGYLYKNMLILAILETHLNIIMLGFITIGLLSSVVYVYRLVYYSAFDTAKEYFLTLIYELQQKQINVVKYWSLTSIIQIFAVSILLSFTVWIYIYFQSLFVGSELSIDHLPIKFESIANNNKISIEIFKSYYELFYSLYTLVVVVLSVISWRVEYTFMFRLNFLLTAMLTCVFGTLFSIIVQLI